jgi:hypothetical protein
MALIGAKVLGALGLSPNGWNQSRNFPVFFPVNKGIFERGEQFAQGLRPPPASLGHSLSGHSFPRNNDFARRKAANAT